MGYNKILKALSQEDQLIMSMRKKINWKKRSYQVTHNNERAEIDIAEIPKYNPYNKRYFILCVDLFSRMLYCEPIESKKKKFVFPALEKIIKKSGSFESVTVDAELSHLDQWFNPRHMNVNVKGKGPSKLTKNGNHITFVIC